MKTKTYMDPAGRVCTKCDEYKLWANFYLNTKDTSGHSSSSCKDCGRLRLGISPLISGHKTSEGYISIWVNGKHLFKHRVIMEIILGRPLQVWEEVHHKNGVRHDNHYENLELWCVSQPRGQRVEDLVDWVVRCYSDRVTERMEETGNES